MQPAFKHVIAIVVLMLSLAAPATARADPWPQSAKSEYFSSCVAVHNARWRGVSEATMTHICTCKVSKLQRFPWEQFAEANKEVEFYRFRAVCCTS